MLKPVRARRSVTPSTYARVAMAALAALTLIVLTGAAVRLTGSGLGCPDWPKCYGRVIAPLETHAVIEYGNRLLSGAVGLVAVAAGALAWLRRPFRRDLALLAALLPLGVAAQAVLGGFTVRNHLAPGFVMSHFVLSMLILVAAVALVWRARREPGEPGAGGRSPDVVVDTRAAGRGRGDDLRGHRGHRRRPPRRRHGGPVDQPPGLPRSGHAGLGDPPARAHRRRDGNRRPAGVAPGAAAWRRRFAPGDVGRAGLMAVQGLVGTGQYLLELPAELVWVHVALACLTWVAVLWSVAAAGSARRLPAGAPTRSDRLSLETVRS